MGYGQAVQDASNVKSQQAGDHMSQALGTVAFTLPHSAELEGQYLAGNLLADYP